MLNFFLSIYPTDQQLNAVKKATDAGMTVLHRAIQNPDSLKIVLALYPEDQRLDALKQVIDKDTYSILHQKYTSSLPPISNNGKTAIHFAAAHLESLKIILDHYPQSQWHEALTLTCAHGDTPLHYAAKNPESLKFILDLFPKEQWLDLLQQPGYKGQTVLHYAAANSVDLNEILPLYPEDKRLDAIKHVSDEGCTALHYSQSSPPNVKTLLEHYPEEQRIAALIKESNEGLSVLDYSIRFNLATGQGHEKLNALLSLYPEEQRDSIIEAAKQKFEKQIQAEQAQEANDNSPETTSIEPSNSDESEIISPNKTERTISREVLKTALDSYQSTSFLGFLSTLWIFSCFINPQRSQAMIELSLLLEHSSITQEHITTALAKDRDGARRISFFNQTHGAVSNGTGTDRVIEQLGEAFRSNNASI